MPTRKFVDCELLFRELFFKELEEAAQGDPWEALRMIPATVVKFHRKFVYTNN